MAEVQGYRRGATWKSAATGQIYARLKRASRFLAGNLLLQGSPVSLHEINERYATHLAQFIQFQQVQAADASLVLADKCLIPTEDTRHIFLSEAAIFANLAEQRQKHLLFPSTTA